MKKFLIIAAALLLCAVSIEAGNPLKKSRLVFDEYVIDVGETPYKKGGSYTFKFPYRNQGEGDLIISAIVPGCYCIVPEYSNDPLKMGQTDTITVTYNPYRSGKFRQMLAVCSNSEHEVLYITVRGDLIEE